LKYLSWSMKIQRISDPAMKLPPIQKKTPAAPRTGASNGPPRARHASGDKYGDLLIRIQSQKIIGSPQCAVDPQRRKSIRLRTDSCHLHLGVNPNSRTILDRTFSETFTQLLNQSQANGAPTAVSPSLLVALPSETTPSPDINNRTRTQSEASSKPSEAGTYDRPSSPPDHNQFNEQSANEHGEFR